MKNKILQAVDDAIRAATLLKSEDCLSFIDEASTMLATCLQNGNKILVAGNGGSLCDAMHFVEELTGQFRAKRPALAAIALADPAHMSCVANDMGFNQVFARGVEALGKSGDVFVALSTSGNSENLYQAMIQAQSQELQTIAFLGKNGGKMKSLADLEWIVSGFAYSDRVQEAHMAAIHIIIEMIEQAIFSKSYAIR